MRLSEDDRDKLTAIARADDASAAEVVRRLIRKEHARITKK